MFSKEHLDAASATVVPRAWDQRDTATFNLNYRLGAHWNFDMAGVYHSGWPTTPVNGVVVNNVFHTVLGAYNSDRLPAYRRVDLRASHNIDTSRGGLSFFVELFNVFGIRNVSGVDGYSFNFDSHGVIVGHRHNEVDPRRGAVVRDHVFVLESGQWSVVSGQGQWSSFRKARLFLTTGHSPLATLKGATCARKRSFSFRCSSSR